MTKTNINKDQIKFENLHKSFFSDIKNTSCLISSDSVVIKSDSKSNTDPASVELIFKDDNYLIYFGMDIPWQKKLPYRAMKMH